MNDWFTFRPAIGLLLAVLNASAFGATNAEVVILADQPIYAMQGGYGANVTAISSSIAVDLYQTPIGSANCLLPDATDTARWNSIFGLMNWSGLDWIRLYLEMNDYEPNRNQFTWDSPNFSRVLKILEWSKANGVDVFLQLQDHASTWNTIPGQNPGSSAPNDVAVFADGFATMVDYLVNTRGFTNIKFVNIANEPGNWWGWWKGGNVKEGYSATRAALDRRGITIPLAGTEFFEGVKNGAGAIVDLTRYNANWNEIKPWLGAWENHDYAESQQGVIAQRPLADAAYPVFWGEFAGGDNTNYDWDITVAKWYVGSVNSGIDGFARWSYLNQNNIDGDFSFIRTYDTVNHRLLDTFSPTPNLYWLDGLVSRFTAKYSTVHAISRDNLKITPAFFVSPNGNQTLVVVNDDTVNSTVTNFKFQGLTRNTTLYRYEVTPTNVKNRSSGVSIASSASFAVGPQAKTFSDTLSPNSVTVYTTYALSPDAVGITADGNYQPISLSTPIANHPVVWDDASANITWSGTWGSSENSANYQSTQHYSNTPGSAYQFSFTGSRFRLYSQQDNGSGIGSVSIDGQFAGYVNGFAPVTRNQRVTFDSGALPSGVHTVTVLHDGRKALTSQDGYLNLDAVGIENGTAPVFTTQPVSQEIYVGQSVTFTAVAVGNPTPTYQWQKNGVAISGATNNSYTISRVTPGDAGNYTVVATNSVSSVTAAVRQIPRTRN